MTAHSTNPSSSFNVSTIPRPDTSPSAYVESAREGILDGVYVIINRHTRLLLELWNGDDRDGMPCSPCPRVYHDSIDHQLWIVRHNKPTGTYILQNIRGGTFLAESFKLQLGFFNIPLDKIDGRILGSQRMPTGETRTDQEWHINVNSKGSFSIQGANSRRFLEVKQTWGLSFLNLTPGSKDNLGQVWDLERVSRTPQEIRAIIGAWRPNLLSKIFQPYPDDAQYIVLPHELRKSIWEREGLYQHSCIKYAFDADDFVTKAKSAANSWARYHFRVGGCSVLFGIIYGKTNKGSKAYNWYLTPDMHTLVFFDAQDGREYTERYLDELGFEPDYATF